MRSNPYLAIAIFSVIVLAIDFYSYRGIKKLTSKLSHLWKRIIFWLFWIVPAIVIVGLIMFVTFYKSIAPSNVLAYFHFLSGTFVLFYLPKLIFIVFNLIDDLILAVRTAVRKNKPVKAETGIMTSRRQFLAKTGMVIAAIPFVSIAYGIKWGRFNFTACIIRPNLVSIWI